MRTFSLLPSLLTLTLASVIGCSGEQSGPPTFPVAGTVTYQGKPLKSGRIAFIPKGSELNIGPPSACKIVDGEFSGTATSGAKKVEVYGYWDSDKTELGEDGKTQIPIVESIPDKFNELSTLEAELTSGPNEGLVFNLE